MNDTIQKYLIKCKRVIQNLSKKEDLFLYAIIVLMGIGSFGLGRLSATKEDSIKPWVQTAELGSISAPTQGRDSDRNVGAPYSLPAEEQAALSTVMPAGGFYVASAKGTKYHLPWCAGASKISEENKVIFKTKDEAEKAGYAPAGNCKGI